MTGRCRSGTRRRCDGDAHMKALPSKAFAHVGGEIGFIAE
jgi:hypothetical protein